MPQNFSGQDLRGQSFANQDLTGADFSHADLRGTDFTTATLVGANLSHARLGLLPYRPVRAIAHSFATLGYFGAMLMLVFGVTKHWSLLSLPTQFLQTRWLVSDLIVLGIAATGLRIRSQRGIPDAGAIAQHPSKKQLFSKETVFTIAILGFTIVIGTALFAQTAMVAAVSVSVIQIFIGIGAALLTPNLFSGRQKWSRWLKWGLLGLFILGRQWIGGSWLVIVWMFVIGYVAVQQAMVAALSLALTCDRISVFRRVWSLAIAWMMGWSLAMVWIPELLSMGASLWLSVALLTFVIGAIAILGDAIARSVIVNHHPIPTGLSLVAIAQRTTNFTGANLTGATLEGINATTTHWREAVLKEARFDHERYLEDSPQLSQILNEHPRLPALLKPRGYVALIARWLLLGLLGFLIYTSYAQGTWPSPQYIGANLHGSRVLQRVIESPTSFFSTLAISSDGRVLAGGTDVGPIELRDTRTGRLLHTLTGHTDAINTLALSADGNHLISGSSDGSVRRWNVNTGQLEQTIQNDDAWFSIVSANGQTFATRNGDTIQVGDVATGNVLHTLSMNQGGGSFVLSPDGSLLIEGRDDMADVWDVQTGQQVHQLQGTLFAHVLGVMLISSDGKTLINGYDEGQDARIDWYSENQGDLENSDLDSQLSEHSIIEQWDLTTGRLQHTQRVYGRIREMVMGPDGRTLIGTDRQEDTIQVWDWPTGDRVSIMPTVSFFIDRLAISPNGQFLASTSSGRTGTTTAIWNWTKRPLASPTSQREDDETS